MIESVIALNGWLGVRVCYDEKLEKVRRTTILFDNFNEKNVNLIPENIVYFFKFYKNSPSDYLKAYVLWDEFSKGCKKIYTELMKIPPGSTISYKKLAERAGLLNGARVVGNAMAKNELPLIIPCHRVIKSDGGLGGFYYGVKYKKRILEWEDEKNESSGC